MTARSLHRTFLRSAAAHPERPALEVDGRVLTYAELRLRALAVAATLQARRPAEGPPLTAVLGQRSVEGFAGILGALCSGHGYVPLLPSMPPARIALMLERSRARCLVVDAAGARLLPEVLPRVPQALTVIGPDDVDEAPTEAPTESPTESWVEPSVGEDDIAYLLFTSGSTGQPKGVMVAHRNIARFLEVVTERYGLRPEDRFSHLFDVTFDLSLFDLFGAWSVGGCLCCPTGMQRLFPARYVDEAGLTVWFSVPSTALLMQQTHALEPGSLPGLRWSLFCGEALPMKVARAFAAAASNSVVENLYGPTELTLACTVHRLGPPDGGEDDGEVVPIGEPYPGMEARVVDESLREVAPGDSGELLMTGPQLALGYWDDPERTATAFVTLPGSGPGSEPEDHPGRTYYRTGDLVRRPREGEPLRFLGRIDSQIKLRGFRVELGEIEAALRQASGLPVAVALGWPVAAPGGAEAVVAFIDDATIDVNAVLERVAERLPSYMVPREIRVVDRFPLNANGKIDRNELRARLGAEPAGSQ
ncbi:amino acid adenylation domain-containing protein [Paraliomyxa miuraensis]|uniref:amino acid adenylation domain-containing protein n=1 Tax=Paraliomyxa miuraensis TaxID=376150 RepID=UPI00224ED48D|nr:amino acid adenylation domain-containing protein [Paraliomyxa miuraensis]MCX4243420.1 amino acid adenylation domain-containing protein [Paraliomyxa miuraensis]